HRDKVLGDRFFVAPETRQQPGTSRVGIRHGLKRREGFRGDNEESLRRVEIADRFREVSAIDIGDEPEHHGAIAVVLERLVSHYRPEVRAANANIDHVANTFAGVSRPLPAPNTIGTESHLVDHDADLGHYVLTVYDDGCSFGR